MTLNVPITPDVEAKLRERAASVGKDFATFVREALEEKLDQEETFAEILAPVHEAFRKCGVTQEHAMDIFERAREQAWCEKRRNNSNAS